MTVSVNNPNMKAAGYKFVVQPPVIRPYSFYDELKLGEDRYLEYLSTTKTVSPELKSSKRRSFFKGLLKTAAAVSAGILIYKNRSGLKNFFVNAYNRIKNMIKK